MLNHKSKNQAKGNGFGYSLFTIEDSHVNTLRARYYKDGSEILLFTETRKRGEIKVSKDNICPTLRAAMGMGGGTIPYIFHYRKRKDEERNNFDIYKDGVVPALTASMGMGGGYVPKLFQWRRNY